MLTFLLRRLGRPAAYSFGGLLLIAGTALEPMQEAFAQPGPNQIQQPGGERRDGGDRGRGDRPGAPPGGFGGGPPGGFGGFGGRGRGGPGGGGVLGELMNPATKTEITISEEQQKKLDEIGQSMMGNRDQFGDIFTRMQSAQSEEEREKIREEMRQRFDEVRKQAESKVKEVLSPEQFKRLDQIRLHREGSRAFANEEVATELGLSKEQRDQIAKLLEERDAARRELGFTASEEDRAKFQQDWDAKLTTVLTEEQKKKWTDRIGPPPADAGQTGGTRPPAPVGGIPAVQPAAPRQIYVEEKPAGAQVVASFGAPRPSGGPVAIAANSPSGTSAGTPSSPEPSVSPEKRLFFNFSYAPWTDVLKLFAEEAGLSLDLNAVPPGTFNYFDSAGHTPTEALDVLNGWLLPKGYCLVRRDRALVCINIDQPIPPNLVPQIAPEEIDKRGKNELLTVIFSLEGVEVGQVAAEVDQIKGPQGKVAGLPSTNSLLVTDIGSNLARIRDLLKAVTSAAGPNAATFKAYTVRNIAAADAESTLRSLLGMSVGVTNVSAGAGDERSRSSSASSGGISITTDVRTNQLLVSATMAQHTLIDQALKTIDVEAESGAFGPSSRKPFLQVYTVSSSDAREVVKTIDALIPGVVINEDGRNNKIHIMATQEQHEQVTSLIRQMDGVGGSMQMAVIPLAKLDPVSATATLRAMFLKDGDTAPTIEADLYGRQIMVRGGPEQVLQIKTLLAQLGEDGNVDRTTPKDTRIRTFILSGRDPEELMPLIQRMWSTNHPQPIRVVTPQTRTPIEGVRRTIEEQAPPARPEAVRPSTDANGLNPDSVQRSTRSGLPVLNASQVVTSTEGSSDVADPVATEPANPASENSAETELYDLLKRLVDSQEGSTTSPAPAGAAPPAATSSMDSQAGVSVTVMGDQLILSSADPQLLNELEEMLERMMVVLPPRTTWTVFTLQTADASEVALMLDQLLPNASVGSSSSSSTSSGFMSSLSGSVSSLGSGLMDMTGLGAIGSSTQTLKIIPELRLNALFVSGPSAQVREVEELLKILDSSEWPDSYREKYSRMIPVQYADAQEVYNMVKEVYKVYLDEQEQRNRQANNPLAGMFGGGGGRSGREEQSRTPPAKLAIGVDTNTNHLIVWADESLFREIEALVQSVDKAAQEARRTVRVVTLQNTSSSVVQSSLGSLMPRVKVSTTGSRSSRSSDPSSSSSTPSTPSTGGTSGAPSGQPSPDQMRSFFEQRMRERMQQGGGIGGPSPFGGGGLSPFGGGGPSPFGGGGPSPFGGGGGRPGGDSGRSSSGRGR